MTSTGSRSAGTFPPIVGVAPDTAVSALRDAGRAPVAARPGAPVRWQRLRTWHIVAACVVFTLALRIPFLTWPLLPDEGGMLMIGRHWSGGEFLYGDYFVGRGMLIAAFFRLGDLMGGALPMRLMGCLAAGVLVVAAGWAGWLIRGRAGAGWAALVAAAYGSAYALSAYNANERLFAAATVMVACGAVLSAVQRPSAWARAVLAGFVATLPLLMVQSFAGALAFAGVVLLAAVQARQVSVRDGVRLALGGLSGVMLAGMGVLVTLAVTPMTLSQFWLQMFGYRFDVPQHIGLHTDMPEIRLVVMLTTATLTGMAVLLIPLLTGARMLIRDRSLRPVWLGVLAMLPVSVSGMAAGGDYWPDYLLQPVPALTMAVALAAPVPTLSGRTMRIGVVLAAVSSVASMVLAVNAPFLEYPREESAMGKWLGAAAEPHDTGLVLFGKGDVLYDAGLASPYPYLWSLLVRTLDPDLHRMVATLSGPDAPTWVIEWSPPNNWNLDSKGHLREVLHERYRVLGRPCGYKVLVLRGEQRDTLPDSICASMVWRAADRH